MSQDKIRYENALAPATPAGAPDLGSAGRAPRARSSFASIGGARVAATARAKEYNDPVEGTVPPKPGDVIDGRFEILNFIGEGAHGLVFRALDRDKSELVALKVLQDANLEPEYSVRLIREAKAMATLTGTSAVHIHGYGSDMDGSFYIAMELLQGMDFEDWLTRLEGRGRKFLPAGLFALLGPIAQTLEAAHERGIVHRDVKPANVFLMNPVPTGGVRLVDFGLVKLKGARRLTKNGIVAGSPSYIAPESWMGDPDVLDHRIDVYSLAVLVFRSLAGRVPFDAASLSEKMNLATRGERPSLHALRPDLPPSIDPWVRRALAIDPAERHPTVRELWTELEEILGGPGAFRGGTEDPDPGTLS